MGGASCGKNSANLGDSSGYTESVMTNSNIQQSGSLNCDNEALRVGTLLLDGTEDPAVVMRRGGVEVTWGTSQVVRKFRERPLPHVVDAGIALPTLYLHMLDRQFLPPDHQMNNELRSGNDNSEVVLVLPEDYVVNTALQGVSSDVASSLSKVLAFLRNVGEVEISRPCARA